MPDQAPPSPHSVCVVIPMYNGADSIEQDTGVPGPSRPDCPITSSSSTTVPPMTDHNGSGTLRRRFA